MIDGGVPVELEEAHKGPRGCSVHDERQHGNAGGEEDDGILVHLIDVLVAHTFEPTRRHDTAKICRRQLFVPREPAAQ